MKEYPRRKFVQRGLPPEVMSKGYTTIPNGLIDGHLGFTNAERLYLQYLMMKPDGYVHYTRDIEKNVGLSRSSIQSFKKKFDFITYTPTGSGAYGSGFTADLSGLLLFLAQDKPLVSNEKTEKPVQSLDKPCPTITQGVSNDCTNPVQNNATNNNYIKPNIKTTIKPEVVTPSANGSDESGAAKRHDKDFSWKSVPSAASDDNEPDADLVYMLLERIAVYFTYCLKIQTPLHLIDQWLANKHKLDEETLNKIWILRENWPAYVRAKANKTDGSLIILARNAKPFIDLYWAEHIRMEESLQKGRELQVQIQANADLLWNNNIWTTQFLRPLENDDDLKDRNEIWAACKAILSVEDRVKNPWLLKWAKANGQVTARDGRFYIRGEPVPLPKAKELNRKLIVGVLVKNDLWQVKVPA